MKSHIVFAILATLGLLASCAQIEPPYPRDMAGAIQSAKSRGDHEALATYYEAAAKVMQEKAQAEKRELAEYRRHAPYYGRMTEELKEHSLALIRVYEDAAERNMHLAKYQRRMAEQAR